ncbi:MAG: hypothetical protein GY934_19585 [Gammaproteobacteria bacterium]|nr:hypothetical protein [Gammaproteobacteria bacterium]
MLFVSGISTAIAESDGRYRAIVLHEGGSSSTSATLLPKVFIMDSRDGHMWTWEQNTRIKTQKGEPTFGNALIYQGRVDPGKKVGEVITQ